MIRGGAFLYRFDLELKTRHKLPKDQFNLIGIDEAGRGPLAGPVVACAVSLPHDFYDPRLNDSKKLDPRMRSILYQILTRRARWAIGTGQVSLIDSINILKATHLAMRTALMNLIRRHGDVRPGLVAIDGRFVPGIDAPQRPITGGDSRSAAIAAASVIAKVFRDRIMKTLSRSYPQYGLSRHKGYGTEMHQKNLRRYGPSPIHRRSFRPVSALLEKVES